MAENKKLTVNFLKGRKKAGTYADGENLYLRASPSGAMSWVFRFQENKTIRQLGLGKAGDGGRSLGDARELAKSLNSAKAKGATVDELKVIINPAVAEKAESSAKTFKVYAEALIALKKADPNYRSKKALNQWTSTLTQYVYPTLGGKRPGDITVNDVYAVLEPLWATIHETATRLRQRIEAVLSHAADEEDLDRFNPAAWQGRLQNRLQKVRSKRPAVKHHAAAEYQDMPTIMAALRQRDSTSAMCLRFSILTAARSGEARGALWSEIDRSKAVWTLPPDRMKAGKPHRVPLCDEALEILDAMLKRRLGEQGKIFAGPNGGLISDVAINKTLHSVAAGVTAHGFRSSFRQWGAERNPSWREALELALAHTNTNKVEGAYQRSDLYEIRKDIMLAWGGYCATLHNVTELKAA